MISHRTAPQHAVARAYSIHAEPQCAPAQTDAGGREIHAARLAAPHDLGVARGDIDIAFERGEAHGLHDTLELRDFHALFQNDIETEIAWRRAAHGEIVHRAVHRERTDIAARNFEWLHGVAVGVDDDFFFARMQSDADGVVAACEQPVAEVAREFVLDQAAHARPAVAVGEGDAFGHDTIIS